MKKKKVMSPEARKKISDGMKRRYATLRMQGASFRESFEQEPDRSMSMTAVYDPDTKLLRFTFTNIEPSSLFGALASLERLTRG